MGWQLAGRARAVPAGHLLEDGLVLRGGAPAALARRAAQRLLRAIAVRAHLVIREPLPDQNSLSECENSKVNQKHCIES